MKHIVPFTLALVFAVACMHLSTGPASAENRGALSLVAPAQAAAVKVAVTYKGKGTVDAKHRIWVWLFDTPNIGPGSMPIAELSIDANGGVAVFDGVSAKQVWIAAAYDESGTMSGDAPPPSGSPIGIFSGTDGAPKSVAPGESSVRMTFDDSQRMP